MNPTSTTWPPAPAPAAFNRLVTPAPRPPLLKEREPQRIAILQTVAEGLGAQSLWEVAHVNRQLQQQLLRAPPLRNALKALGHNETELPKVTVAGAQRVLTEIYLTDRFVRKQMDQQNARTETLFQAPFRHCFDQTYAVSQTMILCDHEPRRHYAWSDPRNREGFFSLLDMAQPVPRWKVFGVPHLSHFCGMDNTGRRAVFFRSIGANHDAVFDIYNLKEACKQNSGAILAPEATYSDPPHIRKTPGQKLRRFDVAHDNATISSLGWNLREHHWQLTQFLLSGLNLQQKTHSLGSCKIDLLDQARFSPRGRWVYHPCDEPENTWRLFDTQSDRRTWLTVEALPHVDPTEDLLEGQHQFYFSLDEEMLLNCEPVPDGDYHKWEGRLFELGHGQSTVPFRKVEDIELNLGMYRFQWPQQHSDTPYSFPTWGLVQEAWEQDDDVFASVEHLTKLTSGLFLDVCEYTQNGDRNDGVVARTYVDDAYSFIVQLFARDMLKKAAQDG
jgi:hypothetical protein